MEVKNPLGLIDKVVHTAQSLAEARQRVYGELEKGVYFIISEAMIDQRIASLWQGKIRARAKALERLKERYKEEG